MIFSGIVLVFLTTIGFWSEYVRHDYGRIPPTRTLTYTLASLWIAGWALFAGGIIKAVI